MLNVEKEELPFVSSAVTEETLNTAYCKSLGFLFSLQNGRQHTTVNRTDSPWVFGETLPDGINIILLTVFCLSSAV